MGIFQSIAGFFRPHSSTPGPLDDFWYSQASSYGKAGVRVDGAASMRITAVYACIRLLSENAGSVPCFLYEKLEGGKVEADSHPLYHLLLHHPNKLQTPFEFWEQVVRCCATRGFSYSEILSDRFGQVVSLRPLHPDRVTHEWTINGNMRYRYTEITGEERIFTPSELFRVMYYTEEDGMTPISPISANADSVGVTEAAERYAASYFGNSALPGGTLEADGKLSPEARREIAASWNRAHRGPDRSGKIAVLDQGLKFNPITINNQDSQLLETRQWQLTDICRIFRVPPHLVQDLTRSTFSNIEHQSLDFATYTMRPWFRRIEQAITRDLLTHEESERYFARFNLADLLAADASARAELYASGIQNGWMTRNEARKFENLNPLDGLDEPLMPSNLRGIDEPISTDPDPPGQQSTSKGGKEE